MTDGFEDQEYSFDDVDLGEVDPEECEQNVTVDKPGKYHFEVEEVIAHPEPFKPDGNEASPHFVAILRVLKTVDGQSPRGSKHYHNVYVAGKGGGPAHPAVIEAACKFLFAVRGLEKSPDGNSFVDPETGSSRFNPGKIGGRIKGAQFVGHLKFDKPKPDSGYSPRLGLHFGNGCFRIDDPKVADVPKSAEDLAAIGIKASSQEPENKPAEKKADEFGDI